MAERKLFTVRKIDRIDPIPGADAIEVATVEGWQVVVKKGEFAPGDYCGYAEIDSFLPTGNPAWQFLVDKQGREFEGVYGHRLRTVKLRGQLSQGFIARIDLFPQIFEFALARKCDGQFCEQDYADFRSEDFAPLLGIKKWEAPLPAELAGQVEGLFPSFIRKTDQERCQNLVNEIFGYEDTKVLIDGLAPEQADQAAILGGKIVVEDGKVYSIRSAKADRSARYEVSMKLDGSSCTIFHNNGEFGVCSRNLQLKINEENASNTFVRIAHDTCLNVNLPKMGNYAIQGELMGPGIQGNRENLKDHELFIFDVFSIDEQRYLTPKERVEFVDRLQRMSMNGCGKLWHVPVLIEDGSWRTDPTEGDLFTLDELNLTNVKELLAFAEGPSLTHPIREGLVFKRIDGGFSFKAISQKYLMNEKD
jgi:hypothetical protein